MASLSISGKLILKEPIVQVSADFIKRAFVIEICEEYHGKSYFEFITFQLVQSKCNLLDLCELNLTYIISFTVRGRKWEKDGKTSFFNTLECWQIVPVAAQSPASASTVLYQPNDTPSPVTSEKDDLPY